MKQRRDIVARKCCNNLAQSVIFYTLANSKNKTKQVYAEEGYRYLYTNHSDSSGSRMHSRRNRRPTGAHSRAGGCRRQQLMNIALFIGQLALLASIITPEPVLGIAPTIDYSHNMRVLKLPKSVRVGELVYRLKGSDGDPSSQLRFGVSGINGRALLDIVPVPNSWNEADVYLRTKLTGTSELDTDQLTGSSSSSLNGPYRQQHQQQHQHQQNPSLPVYNLTVYVSDGNKSTQVESTIIVTDDDELDSALPPTVPFPDPFSNNRSSSGLLDSAADRSFYGNNASRSIITNNVNVTSIGGGAGAASSSAQLLSPFIRPRHVFNVPENTAPGETIGSISVRESDKSDLPVRFELRGPGSDYFSVKYVFGPRGQSHGQLSLAAPLDYERQNLFSLKVLALNAWTNTKYDTRNVATLDIVISVGDVQDTAPQFKHLPHLVRLTNTMQAGDLVARVHAEDGDYGDQRPVQYALDASSPLVKFFTIDKQSGEIRLTRGADELAPVISSIQLGALGSAAWSQPMLEVYASELPDASSYDHLWPPMLARAELPLLMVDLVNEPPRFVGGWQTQASVGQLGATGASGMNGGLAPTTILHGYLREPTTSSQQQPLATDQDDLVHEPSQSGGQSVVQWHLNSTAPVSPAVAVDTAAAYQQQQQLRAKPMVVDLGQGANGTFVLSLEGPDAHLFELEPDFAVSRQTIFNLFVAPNANRSLFDADLAAGGGGGGGGGGATPEMLVSPSGHQGRVFQVDVVARDFGTPQRLSSRVRCLIQLLDVNDNAPQFEQDLYLFSIYENAPLNQLVGSVRARDPDTNWPDSGQRVRYSSLTGRDSQTFKLDPDSGLITLAGPLDRERQDQYLLLAEVRDSSGGPGSNYTRIIVDVLDANDNAPVFSQSHYDAVLLADGTFHQPLVVKAFDADEPNSANSQVSYEIIAGNQNDQFAIDSLSGTIYLVGSPQQGAAAGAQQRHQPLQSSRLPAPIQLPSILNEPIVPYSSNGNRQQHHHHQLDQHGKIQPGHEVEETTVPSHGRIVGHTSQHQSWASIQSGRSKGQRSSSRQEAADDGQPASLRSNWPRTATGSGPDRPPQSAGSIEEGAAGDRLRVSPMTLAESPMNLLEQLPALDLLLNLDAAPMDSPGAAGGSHRHAARSAPASEPTAPPPTSSPPLVTSQRESGGLYFDALKVPPLTTLIVRAHDYGIPLRSATCKVNIYNQALLSRSISVILNGTAEQLEQRRDMIERAFGALTASKAQIESIDALSDSSSISVARLRLSIPAGHSLIDLTDLSSLMQALDYKGAEFRHHQHQHQHQQLDEAQRQSLPGSIGTTTHYIAAGDRLYPVQATGHFQYPLSNLTPSTATDGGQLAPGMPSGFYTDINKLTLDSNMLERKLLFYIIIVGICILVLLVIWMIYFCCREDYGSRRHQEDDKAPTESARKSSRSKHLSAGANSVAATSAKGRNKHRHSSSKTQLIDDEAQVEAEAELEDEGRECDDGRDLATVRRQSGGNQDNVNKTHAKVAATGLGPAGRQAHTTLGGSAIGNNLAKPHGATGAGAGEGQFLSANPLMRLSSDHYSMYNGQVWFEQGGLRVKQRRPPIGTAGRGVYADERRASSAPSAGNSFDSSLHTALAGRTSAMSPASGQLQGQRLQRNQFFPNTIGYMQNLAAMDPTAVAGAGAGVAAATTTASASLFGKRNRRRQVVPMTLLTGATGTNGGAFDNLDLESGTSGGASGGALVLVPASSLALANGLRHAHRLAHTTRPGAAHKSRAGHRSEDGGASLSSSRSSACSSSASSATGRTLAADSHESVLLDSDQELLGFDSTGTPIIATHTRRPSGHGPGTLTTTTRSLLSEATTTVPSTATGIGTAVTSPTPTVIQQPAPPLAVVSDTSRKVGVGGGRDADKVDAEKRDGATGTLEGAGQQAGAKEDGARQSISETRADKRAETNEMPKSEPVTTTTTMTRRSGGNERQLDLMGELNERFSARNQGKQARALRRQSADADELSRRQVDDEEAAVQAKRTTEEKMDSNSNKNINNNTNNNNNNNNNDNSDNGKQRGRRGSGDSLSCQSSASTETAIANSLPGRRLGDMKNGELLEKQSIFAMTYSGLATDKLPS